MNKRKIIVLALIAVFCITGGIIMLFSSCGSSKYKVDYCGQMSSYKRAKEYYRAGQEVKLYYNIIATDTDYSFFLDGKSLKTEYSEKNGYMIYFVMPSHDVKLECKTYNSMEFTEGNTDENNEIMLVDYYTAVTGTETDRGYTELTLYALNAESATLKVFRNDTGDGEEIVEKYTVPYEAVEKCLETAKKYKFADWRNLKDTYPIDGSVTIVKYYDGKQYIKVSTDAMPEGGERQLDEIARVMRSYIK